MQITGNGMVEMNTNHTEQDFESILFIGVLHSESFLVSIYHASN